MLLDIKKIFASYDAPVVRTQTLDLSGADFPGYTVKSPVGVRFTATLEGTAVRLAMSIRAVVQAQCARCLDDIERTYTFERVFFIREAEWASADAELPFKEDGRLDVDELAYEEIVLEVPSVLLCSENCLGLCPVCGHRKPCACRHETSDTTDERLAILKQLLK